MAGMGRGEVDGGVRLEVDPEGPSERRLSCDELTAIMGDPGQIIFSLSYNVTEAVVSAWSDDETWDGTLNRHERLDPLLDDLIDSERNSYGYIPDGSRLVEWAGVFRRAAERLEAAARDKSGPTRTP